MKDAAFITMFLMAMFGPPGATPPLRAATPMVPAASTPTPTKTGTGTVQVLHIDDQNRGDRYEYRVCPDDEAPKCYLFRRGAADDRFQHGDRVRFSKTKDAKGVTIWTVTPLVQRAGGDVVAQVSGTHKTAIILLDFTDGANLVRAPADGAASAAWVKEFYRAASYGTLNLDIDVIGPYKIAASNKACDYYGNATKADAAVKAAGVNLAQYIHRVYAQPGSSQCSFAGLGTVGGNPSQAWLNGGGIYAPILAHELGHNVGLWHSHAMLCGGTSLGTQCHADEYGDVLDIMGQGSSAKAHFNAAQKRLLGWLTPRTVGAGTYNLTPLEMTPDALRVPRANTTDALYLELRQQAGGKPGIVMHLQSPATNASGIYLLDMSPTNSVQDPALPVTVTWPDPKSKTTFRVDSVSTSAAKITIDGEGPNPPPELPPPDTPPPTIGSVTKSFKRAQVLVVDDFKVDVDNYRCALASRTPAILRVAKLVGTTEQIKKSISAPVPAKDVTFTIRCVVGATAVDMYLDNVLKITTPK